MQNIKLQLIKKILAQFSQHHVALLLQQIENKCCPKHFLLGSRYNTNVPNTCSWEADRTQKLSQTLARGKPIEYKSCPKHFLVGIFFFFFFFLRFYVEASELFHVASGLENILKQTAQSNCHHCLNLMKIG